MRIGLSGPLKASGLAAYLTPGDAGRVPPDRDGGTVVTVLARGLLERGHEVLVTSLDHGVERELVLDGPRLRIRLGPLRKRHRGRDAYRPERAYLRAALRAERPDAVHAHWTYEYALGALASGVPTLVTVHDWAPTILRLAPDPYRAVRLGMAAATFARGRSFTVPSPYLGARVRRLRAGRVALVPNGLPDDAFAPVEQRPSGTPRLLAINDGFDRRKNVAVLLDAFALVRRSFPACVLDLAGTGHQPGGPAQAWAQRHGLADAVTFHGPVAYSRVRELMAAATVFVHPSLEESFGLVLVEAMAQALPVIGGARSGAVPWVLSHGAAGVLTDVTSAGAVAAAVAGLLDDPERARASGKAGHEHAYQHFRLSPVLDGYLRAYAELV